MLSGAPIRWSVALHWRTLAEQVTSHDVVDSKLSHFLTRRLTRHPQSQLARSQTRRLARQESDNGGDLLVLAMRPSGAFIAVRSCSSPSAGFRSVSIGLG